MKPIPRITVKSREEFETLLRSGRPVILQGLNLGPCVDQWSLDTVASKAGKDREVRKQEQTAFKVKDALTYGRDPGRW